MGKNKSNMSFLIDNYCMEDALPISMKSCENQIKKFNSSTLSWRKIWMTSKNT